MLHIETETEITAARSRNMSRIRGKDTKPELIVRKFLWSRGFRYRLNHKRLPGKPDIVLRKYRTCIFVNGCFWHGHRVAIGEVQEGSKVQGVQGMYNLQNPETTNQKPETIMSSECCKIPQTRREFWVAKILRNMERDIEVQKKLAEMGWHCITVWECELRSEKRKAKGGKSHSEGNSPVPTSEIMTVRERTLESLAHTLNHIYLMDHSQKCYILPEEERQMVAEDMMK